MLANPTFKSILITIDIKDMLKGISRKDKHFESSFMIETMKRTNCVGARGRFLSIHSSFVC